MFHVNCGPKEETWSLKDFEAKFTLGRAWGKMQENVWTVPTMNLPDLLPNADNPEGRVAPDETVLDLEQYLLTQFEKHCNQISEEMPDREKRRREKNPTKLAEYINSQAVKQMKEDPKLALYEQKQGDIAEMVVIDALQNALSGIPSLIVRGINTFQDFPKSLSEAGIKFSDRSEHDVIVLVPREDILHVRYIEVKRQILMPWDTRGKRIHDDLIKSMNKQLTKDITAFYEFFPDFPQHQVNLKVLGAMPFTNAPDLCSITALL